MTGLAFFFGGTGDDSSSIEEDRLKLNDDVIRVHIKGCQNKNIGGGPAFPDLDIGAKNIRKSFHPATSRKNSPYLLSIPKLIKNLDTGIESIKWPRKNFLWADEVTLYLMLELPKDMKKYKCSYIYIDNENNKELYFVNNDGKHEKVNINSISEFDSQINKLKKTEYVLKGEDVNKIITSNGGHKPWNYKEKYSVISSQKKPERMGRYRDCYIYVNNKKTNELYYVNSKGKSEKVKINSFSDFDSQLSKVDDIYVYSIALNREQIQSIITSNGGHKTYDMSSTHNLHIESIALSGFSRGGVSCFATARHLNDLGIDMHIVANQPVPGNLEWSSKRTTSEFSKNNDLSGCKNIKSVTTLIGEYDTDLGYKGAMRQMIPQTGPNTISNTVLLPFQKHNQHFRYPDVTHGHIGVELADIKDFSTKRPKYFEGMIQQGYITTPKGGKYKNVYLDYKMERKPQVYGNESKLDHDNFFFKAYPSKKPLYNDSGSLIDSPVFDEKELNEINNIDDNLNINTSNDDFDIESIESVIDDFDVDGIISDEDDIDEKEVIKTNVKNNQKVNKVKLKERREKERKVESEVERKVEQKLRSINFFKDIRHLNKKNEIPKKNDVDSENNLEDNKNLNFKN